MSQNTDTLFFSSDYMEGAHPAVLDALSRTNLVSTEGYGEDAYCRDAQRRILEACSLPDGEVRFLIGGTQTNQFVIDCLLPPCSGVLCPGWSASSVSPAIRMALPALSTSFSAERTSSSRRERISLPFL